MWLRGLGGAARAALRSGTVTALSPLRGPAARRHPLLAAARGCSARAAGADGADDRPTRQQLNRVFVNSAVPFVAFGFVDQSVLLWAGDAIDNSLGVALGLPTLAAAAMGQVMSDTCGVMFGGTIETLALKLGLPLPGLTDKQLRMGITKRVSTAGGVVGVICGCLLGMCNLFVIDVGAADRAKQERKCESMMRTIMDDGKELMNSDFATMWAVDEAKNELWTDKSGQAAKLSDNPQDKALIRIPCTESGSIAGWVYHHRESVRIDDVQHDPRFAGNAVWRNTAREIHVETMICGPVIVDEEVVAVIQFVNKRDAEDKVVPFDDSDMKVLKMLSGHTGIFLEQLSD